MYQDYLEQRLFLWHATRPRRHRSCHTLEVWLSSNAEFSWSSSAKHLTGYCRPSWLGGTAQADVTLQKGERFRGRAEMSEKLTLF